MIPSHTGLHGCQGPARYSAWPANRLIDSVRAGAVAKKYTCVAAKASTDGSASGGSADDVGVAVDGSAGGSGVAVGGSGVAVGGKGVAVGGSGVAVGGKGVAVGGSSVAVGGSGVAVGVAVGGSGVAVGVAVGGDVAVGVAVGGGEAVGVAVAVDGTGTTVIVSATGEPLLPPAVTSAHKPTCGGRPVITVSPVMRTVTPSTTQELAPIAPIGPRIYTGSTDASTAMRLAVQGPPATRHTSTVADLPTAGAPLMTVEPSTITQRLPMNHWLPPISRMIPVKVSVSTAPGCTWINLASSVPFACSQAST